MRSYNLINQQTRLLELTGTYDECLNLRSEFITEMNGVTSRPSDYFKIEVATYVIAWESGRGIRYADRTETGAELISNAIEFDEKERAEEYLLTCGDHCYVAIKN